MNYTSSYYTNRGGRTLNEDSFRLDSGENLVSAVLADGLGGHDCGEVASEIAASVIFAGLGKSDELDASDTSSARGEAQESELLSLFEEANRIIREQQSKPGQRGMKTTAVALSVIGNCAHWAHIGDSRLYHFSADSLLFMTKDHSVSYRKYLGGQISRLDICHDDDRSSLLRVLGNETCQPDFGTAAISAGDAFLLCSDGFWEYVYDDEMLIDLLKAETPEQWMELMLLRHIRRCPPGNDNFTAITVFAEEAI